MEALSSASFLHHGHAYVLYAYEEVANIPAGTTVKDANSILPESAIFQYQEHASYAGFANFFRYKLLMEEGGWWADTDVICIKRFDFEAPYVFGAQSRCDSECTAWTR